MHCNGHLLPLYRVPADRRRAFKGRPLEHAAADRQVPFDYFAPSKLPTQLEVNRVGFCNYQTAGRVLVQSVNNPRPRFSADRTQRARPG